MNISQTVFDFCEIAILFGDWEEMDRVYVRNRLLALIGETKLEKVDSSEHKRNKITNTYILSLANQLVDQAVINQMYQDETWARDCCLADIMNFITPKPSVVNEQFNQKYNDSPQKATEYFFDLSRRNNYIKVEQIAKNIVFPVDTEYGKLQITINLSKPEKDPKEIALAKSLPASSYPKCLLCMENEGYEGTVTHPARSNHRIIRMELTDEEWGLQYSPYAYYNEHCIVLCSEHRPMKIGRQTFERLLEFVQKFPHYFAGSNADLPIVGGSILSHDHYQGGRHTFPMEEAVIETEFCLSSFPSVTGGIVKWPMSVIRLQSQNPTELVDAAVHIFNKWKSYSDLSLDISASSDDGMEHHTITPIARKRDGLFELDLVLRDNNISEEFPNGIFHPHQDVQHIKKENIGLIEVMGLAVLPPRLKNELEEVEKFLLDDDNEIADYHVDWANVLSTNYDFSEQNVKEIVQREVGFVFQRVLEDAGIYKRNELGREGFLRFIEEVNR